MTEIKLTIDGKEETMTLEEFFENYWGLFRYQVIKAVNEELLSKGKLRRC